MTALDLASALACGLHNHARATAEAQWRDLTARAADPEARGFHDNEIKALFAAWTPRARGRWRFSWNSRR